MLNAENQKARRGMITASAFAALAAGGASRASVVARLVGEIRKGEFTQTKASAAMDYGTENERNVINAFTRHFYERHPENVVYNEHFYTPPENPLGVGATPDALICDLEPLEVKSPASAEAYYRQIKTPPDKYKWQVKFQIWILEQVFGRHIRSGQLVFGNPDNTDDCTSFRIDLEDTDRLYIHGVCASVRREIDEALARPHGAVAVATTLATAIQTAADAGAEMNAIEAHYKAAQARLTDIYNRLRTEADERRTNALTFVQASLADTPKHERPKGVVYRASSKVKVDDVADLPPEYVKVVRSADKRKLGAALREGEIIPGATLEETEEVSVPASRIRIAEVITDQFLLKHQED